MLNPPNQQIRRRRSLTRTRFCWMSAVARELLASRASKPQSLIDAIQNATANGYSVAEARGHINNNNKEQTKYKEAAKYWRYYHLHHRSFQAKL
mmetsp:Transcript_48110/g.56236  ORF Transcript_48110/g.56236 Transcript_48110/m.56236 type:complete len:94 (-) Transcript_48110:68-349(-)